MHECIVLLNHNFVSTHVDTCGNMRYFTCKMPKFAMEIKISMTTRRDVNFSQDMTFP